MSSIITISRQFGSGGREVGKKLADKLDIAYYDKELISEIAKESGLSSDYIEKYSDKNFTRSYPFVFGRAFVNYQQSPGETVFIEQTKVIQKLAETGDFIIIGRGADAVLKDHNPFKVFIYASDEGFRLRRSYEKVPNDQELSEKEMLKKMRHIDKQRSECYQFFTGNKWADMQNYHLCIDTSCLGVSGAVEVIAKALQLRKK